MHPALIEHINLRLGIRISNSRPISGGDISRAYMFETKSEYFFCKVNEGVQAYAMFLAEKVGLESILKTKALSTPEIFLCEKWETGAYLVMEYIAPKRALAEDLALLGRQLAALHKNSTTQKFGWETDNFIGSLPQSNQRHADWTDFYIHERLLPQLRMAHDKGLLHASEIPLYEILVKTCDGLFPGVVPSLLHGDLWGGNYLIAQNGTPYLIDPATYYGHCEVDLAMTRLFGGFGTSFYDAYYERFPKIGGEAARNDLYQLYYLMVHLNLFGRSYYAQVKNILKRYF